MAHSLCVGTSPLPNLAFLEAGRALCSPERSCSRLGASRGASKPAVGHPQNDDCFRTFNQVLSVHSAREAAQAAAEGAEWAAGWTSAARYAVLTSKRLVRAEKLIIAINPLDFVRVSGDIASALKHDKLFQDTLLRPVSVLVQKYATP